MRMYLLIYVCLLMMPNCGFPKHDKIRDYIPGIYVRYSDHELRKEHDTLQIELISEKSNSYRIIKSSSFQRKRDGKVYPLEYTKEVWAAIYDQNSGVLNENLKGRVFSFIPDQKEVLVGTSTYKKIN